MAFGRNIEKESEAFFKNMGLEDEIAKMADIYTDNFMIKGEITENLQEILQRSPDSLFDLIWEELTIEDSEEELTREEKEQILFQRIPDSLHEQLIYMEPKKMNLLLRVAAQDRISMMETTVVHEEFVKPGWVFMFVLNNVCSFVVSKEVKEVLLALETEEIRHDYEFLFIWRSVVNICLGMYGVCKKEQILNVFQSITAAEKDDTYVKWGEENLDDLLSIFEEQGTLWKDGNYIIHRDLQDKKEYSELLRRQNKNYYMPEQKLIESYALGTMLVKDEPYQKVCQLLTKELRDVDQAEEMLKEISGYVIREDWEIPQVLTLLQSWEVYFWNERSQEKFTSALAEWLYGIHRWSECGYSRKELKKENRDLKYVLYAKKRTGNNEVNKKVYPNAPCPCGSGKKYKRCCGR